MGLGTWDIYFFGDYDGVPGIGAYKAVTSGIHTMVTSDINQMYS
jgi:hypothetical protein